MVQRKKVPPPPKIIDTIIPPPPKKLKGQYKPLLHTLEPKAHTCRSSTEHCRYNRTVACVVPAFRAGNTECT